MPNRCEFGCVPKEKPMHRFPCFKMFPERFKTWVSLVGGKLESESDWQCYKKKFICARHFTIKDGTRSKRLNALAVPTLHIPDSHPLLHKFPNPNKFPDRFRSWVTAVGGDILGLDNQFIYANRKVCHRHFLDEHCCRFNKLSQLAVPRKNLPGLCSIPKFTFSARPLKALHNIVPLTSKDEYGLFGPEYSARHHSLQENSGHSTHEEEIENVTTAVVDTEVVEEPESPPANSPDRELSPICIAPPTDSGKKKEKSYKCMGCSKTITGFRYACVQCLHYDICSECEGRGAHRHHYVLRIPRARPPEETECILERVRSGVKALLAGGQTTELTELTDDIKEEEEEEELPDPLQDNSIESLGTNYDETKLDVETEVDEPEDDELEDDFRMTTATVPQTMIVPQAKTVTVPQIIDIPQKIAIQKLVPIPQAKTITAPNTKITTVPQFKIISVPQSKIISVPKGVHVPQAKIIAAPKPITVPKIVTVPQSKKIDARKVVTLSYSQLSALQAQTVSPVIPAVAGSAEQKVLIRYGEKRPIALDPENVDLRNAPLKKYCSVSLTRMENLRSSGQGRSRDKGRIQLTQYQDVSADAEQDRKS